MTIYALIEGYDPKSGREGFLVEEYDPAKHDRVYHTKIEGPEDVRHFRDQILN